SIYFLYRYVNRRDLPSFPTRRSSDLRRHVGIDSDALLFRLHRHHAHGFGDDGVEMQFLEIEPETAGLNLRHVEDVVDDVEEIARSEEHTSELQSREKLVCRLLLEKKN